MATILCFGDSNTHGTPPMSSLDHHPRLTRRWPVVLGEVSGHTIIEDGLPGRTACPLIATTADVHLDGHLGLRMALGTHGPLDHLIIMLGTNDLKADMGKSPDDILAGLAGLMLMAHAPDVQANHGGFGVTLVAPPPIDEVGTFVPELRGGADKSRALTPLIQDLATAWGAGFLEAGQHITAAPEDGTHFDAAAHVTLGTAIANALDSSKG